MKVLILHDDLGDGARPDQADVFAQAEVVEQALAGPGRRCSRRSFGLDLGAVAHALRRERPDVVFNLVESAGGRGQLVHLAPALLDTLGVPYTGTRTEGMFLSSHKLLTKEVLRSHGIATPEWVTPRGPVFPGEPPAGRYLIKSVWEDASLGIEAEGIVEAESPPELVEIIAARAPELGGEAFAERFIDGRELNLSLLAHADGRGIDVLPPAEIIFEGFAPDQPRVVGYRAKWDPSSHEYHHTPRSFRFGPDDEPLLAEVTRLAREVWRVLGLGGYARVDFRIDATGQPWVLEANANPCLSPDAGFPAAAAEAGIEPRALIERIVGAALAAAGGRASAG